MLNGIAAAMRSRQALRLSAIALASVGLLVVLSQAGPGRAALTASCAATGSETVATDRSSYQPGDSVAISGNGYGPNCNITIEVAIGTSKDDLPTTTGSDGSLSSPYNLLAAAAEGTYTVKVLESSPHPDTLASTDFTVAAASDPSGGATGASGPSGGSGASGATGATGSSGSTCASTNNETLSSDKSSYHPGDTIHLTGSGYAAACPVTIKVDLPGGSSDTFSDTTSAAGALSHDYALAAGAADGTYKFTVLDGSNNELASKSVSVLTPGTACASTNPGTVQTDQSHYTAGDTVQVTGGGYDSQCGVQVRITKPGGATDSGGATTDFSGNFGFGYQIASDAATGSYTVDVLGANEAVLASNTFQVEAGTGAICARLGSENVDTNTSEYVPGKTVTVFGGSYSHLCGVLVKITRPDGSVVKADGTPGSDTATTSIGGAFSYNYPLPASAAAGQYKVEVLGLADVTLATATFQVGQPLAAFVSTKLPDYSPGDHAEVDGGNWAPGETVRLVFHPSPQTRPDTTIDAVADGQGNIRNTQFVLQNEDVGVAYSLGATGLTSGKTASTTFNDSLAGDCFRSKQNGNWVDLTTWESAPASTGCTAWANASLIPGSAAQSIEIQNGHTVHVTDARTGNHITIDAGGDLEVDSGKTFSFNNGASTDMTVNGTFGVSGTAAMSAGTDHIVNGTFVIRSGGAATLFGSGATITVNSGGNFTVASGGSFTPAGSAASLIMIQSGATASIDGPVSGLGNLTVNGTLTSSANITLSAPSDLEVGGTMTLTGSAVLVTAKTGVGVVGNINNGGTLKLQDTAKWGIGNATTAASCSTGGSSCASVNSGGTLDIGPGAVVQGWGGAALNTTDGYLIVASGATLKIGSASGIAAPGTNSGNVQTKNRTFDTGANYTYDGGAANTGTGLPSTVNNLTIANTSGVVTPTGSPQTVNGTLTVASGASLQKIGVFTLNLGAGGVSNAGTIELRSAAGCGVIDTITIRSTTTSTQRAWAGAGTFTIADADIKDQAGTAAITALSSTNSGNNGANWNIIPGCTADSTPPTSTITFPTNTTYSSSTWTSGGGAITGTANDNVAVSSVGVSIQDGSGNYWNGSAFGSVTEVFNAATSADSFAHWSYSFPAANMTSGHSYTVRSKATDTSSIAETSPPSVTFTFQNDGTPPTSAITFPVNGTAYNASSWTGSVTGTASDTGGSGLQKVEVQISDTTNSTHFDGTNFVSGATGFITATGPTPWSQTLAAAKLTTGHGYTVTSKATDNAANVESSPPSVGFTYDTTAPTVTIVSASPGTIGAGGTSTVTWHASENGSFSVRVGGSDCSTGNQIASGSYSSSPSNTTTDVHAADLTNGANTIRVCVTDAANNPGSDTTTVTLDTTPPNVPTLSNPADGSTIGTDSPTLQWSDESASGATNYDVLFVTKGASCDFTGQSPTNVSTNSQAKSGLADATFCWKVRAVDAHGNASAYSSTFEFTVDTTPPDVPDLSTPTDGSTINSNPNFTWSSESASGATKYDLQYVTKGATCDFTVGATTVSDIVGTSYTTAFADGTYCWRVRSADAYTNKSAYSSAFTFTKAPADADGDGIPNGVDCSSMFENKVVDPSNVTGLTLGTRRFNTLQAAVTAAADNNVITMYADTTENVAINNGKDLLINGCGHKVKAASGSNPTIDIQSGAGANDGNTGAGDADIQIQNITVNGGKPGINVATVKTNGKWTLIKGFRADSNTVGVQLGGSGNEVSGANSIAGNGQGGVVVTGSNQSVHDNRITSNGQGGIIATTSNSSFNKNKVGDSGAGNTQDGISVTGNNNTINENDVYANTRNGITVNGNTNTVNKNDVGDSGKGNGQDGINITGNGNIAGIALAENDVFANGRDGIAVNGNSNVLSKNQSGDKGKGNGRDGFNVSGYGNQLIENVAMADGASSAYPDRDGFLIQGGTAANPNVLVKNVAGDSDKGNGRNGFTLVGAGNGTASPIELEQNTAQGNKADGFAFKNGSSNGTGWQLKNNISGGSSGQKNGGCAYSSPSGITNYNATGNKANNVLVPGALNSVFPTGCIN